MKVKESPQTDKLNFLSLTKGFAIFLMLWGHCIQYCCNDQIDYFENSVFKFIYSFHMPFFMLISGYLFYFSFKKRELGELLKNRIQGLLQPIIVVSMINYYLTTGVHSVHPPVIKALVNGAWLENLPSLWFLWSTLVSVVIVGVSFKLTKNTIIQCFLLCVGLLFAIMMPCAIKNVFMLPYFILGFLFPKIKCDHKELVDKYTKYTRYISLIIFPLMLAFFEKKHYIYTTGLYSSDYGFIECIIIDLFRWIIGLAGSIFALVILDLVYKLLTEKNFTKVIGHGIEIVGKYSLQMYCVSVLVLSAYLKPVFRIITSKIGLYSLPNFSFVYNYIVTPIIAILYVLIIYIIIKILEKAKISKIIFGR